ncbi:hypothetical protein [Microbacterium sufflavum]|uniref:Uncharacterized protein n=1 Tax=Microbacterium sufflavum TaxID=2851649 RepID=A0ABY4IGH1_9MICO|nr:hypothetical protein [Microbacterium sufflavum]UPL10598.1 hypothetical protein KV394_05550 [Microbacterium sufflavum]
MKESRPAARPGIRFTSMPHALGRRAREDIVWEALERIDGKPTPDVGTMQAAMGNEAEIRLVRDTVRAYLDARGVRDTAAWAARIGAAE